MAKKQKKLSQQKDEKILEKLKENANDWFDYWKTNNEHYQFHTEFLNGDQWEPDVRQTYDAAKRPIVTFNKIRPYIKQILGEYRNTNFEIFLRKIGIEETADENKMLQGVFDAMTGGAQNPQVTQNTSATSQQNVNAPTNPQDLIKSTPIIPADPKLKTLEGLIRQIGYSSEASDVYYGAGKCALEGGFGAIHVLNSYQDEINQKQKLYLQVRKNPTHCFWDRFAELSTKIDGDYCGCVTPMSRTTFERLYPDAKSPNSYQPVTNVYSQSDVFTYTKNEVTVGEEYVKEYFDDVCFTRPSTGEMFYKSDLDEKTAEEYERNDNFEKIKCENFKIIYYKFTANEILEKTECPSKYCCIIFVDGNSYWSGNRQYVQSFIADAVDIQRSINFTASDILQWMRLARSSNIIYPAEVLPEELKPYWKSNDTPVFGYPYSGKAAAMYGKPEVISPPEIPVTLLQKFEQLKQDLQEALGRYPANIGAPSNEQSGVAVANRAIQGSTTVTPYKESLRKAAMGTGKVLLSAIPRVYDDERILTIQNRDGSTEELPVNKPIFSGASLEWNLNIDMKNLGSWDIEVKCGATNEMQRQLDIENMETLIKMDTSGQSYNLLAPLLAEDLDSPRAKQIATRLSFLTPLPVLAAEQGKTYTPPPNPVAQLQLQNAQLDLMKKESEIQNDKLKALSDRMEAMAKMLEAQTSAREAEYTREIEPAKLQTELLHAEMKSTQNNSK